MIIGTIERYDGKDYRHAGSWQVRCELPKCPPTSLIHDDGHNKWFLLQKLSVKIKNAERIVQISQIPSNSLEP
ncbi:hypothetical protein CEXT_618971 [Caerostris extrusa]|uniref:Uncharacterized protein n=1 Tax=Caerostris extrusa TaxID=172846 RepID=A0AAV4T658_CAEEX|nr:hypothetical protein CEXT_618971 [Caerostris extrusa]